ncbi:phosphotriesterase family protein [Negadavirga shengliensis]|uniref:Phosphotriesterase n=1 Tax=Negadavirga shengliensis TaxID=1389218 RepID=A0ABV9T7Y2_9BACT
MGRHFWVFGLLLFIIPLNKSWSQENMIMTVKGSILPEQLGTTLIHEHILVDFIGASEIKRARWNSSEVAEVTLPYLKEAKDLSINSLIDCTPAYLGRDPLLLYELSDKAGLHILTNTGYYGAVDNKYLPAHAFSESVEQLAERWVSEWKHGIEGTEIRPGFIKIGVNNGPLSEIHQKLIRAAALTHLRTGLVIASHTGPYLPAKQQIQVLLEEGVSPEAFIWVHAQAEKDYSKHTEMAGKGVWISLDGINEDNLHEYLEMAQHLKQNGLTHKMLISHDAGWYSPGEESGGDFRPFSTITRKFIPLLLENGWEEADIRQLLEKNPAKAFAVRVRSTS